MKEVLLRTIDWYRARISPQLPGVCRYDPTCSAYAREAIVRFGAARGLYLTVRRLLRCHPLRPGGYDPVPERFSFRRVYPPPWTDSADDTDESNPDFPGHDPHDPIE